MHYTSNSLLQAQTRKQMDQAQRIPLAALPISPLERVCRELRFIGKGKGLSWNNSKMQTVRKEATLSMLRGNGLSDAVLEPHYAQFQGSLPR